MKKHYASLTARLLPALTLAAFAALALSACERTQPTPDPAPTPPAPQTFFDHVVPSVHHAVFTYPATGTLSGQPQNPVMATKYSLVQT